METLAYRRRRCGELWRSNARPFGIIGLFTRCMEAFHWHQLARLQDGLVVILIPCILLKSLVKMLQASSKNPCKVSRRNFGIITLRDILDQNLLLPVGVASPFDLLPKFLLLNSHLLLCILTAFASERTNTSLLPSYRTSSHLLYVWNTPSPNR